MAGKNGGARPGAGRPKGSTTRPQLRDMLTQDQIDALVAKGLEKADSGDSVMLKFLLEQVFGRAPQPLTDADGEPITVIGFNFLKHERNTADDTANG